MPGPAPSQLDFEQILPHAFDDSTGRLRVDAEASINVDGQFEVVLNADDDSVAVSDGTNTLAVNSDGTIDIKNITGAVASLAGPTTSVITSISRSNVTQTALASNASRKGAIFNNNSGAVCYLAYAATASTTLYTVRLASNSAHILERHDYTGVVSVIWGSNGAGSLIVTELT